MRPATSSIETSRSTELPKKAFDTFRAPSTTSCTPISPRVCMARSYFFRLFAISSSNSFVS